MTVLIVAQQNKYACIYGHIHTDTPPLYLFSNVIYMHITVYISVVSSLYVVSSVSPHGNYVICIEFSAFV